MVPEGVQQEDQEGSRFSGGMGQLQRGPEKPYESRQRLGNVAPHRTGRDSSPSDDLAEGSAAGLCPAVCALHILRPTDSVRGVPADREHQRAPARPLLTQCGGIPSERKLTLPRFGSAQVAGRKVGTAYAAVFERR
jgi:hypothetical protein